MIQEVCITLRGGPKMPTSYKDIGLANTNDMFRRAFAGQYAVPAYNFNNMEQLQAIITACVETRSPVILQVSSGARKYANQTLLRYLAEGAAPRWRGSSAGWPGSRTRSRPRNRPTPIRSRWSISCA